LVDGAVAVTSINRRTGSISLDTCHV
jgi:hypothetical protein